MQTYLITQENLSAGRTSEEIVEAAIAGGVDVIQIREKGLSAREQLSVAESVREPTASADVQLIINDRVDVAVAADADGVHLGDDDLPIQVAREQLGENALIGRSVSTVKGAKEAENDGADYLGVGAIYSTDSKDVDEEQHNIGLEVVTNISEAVEIPFVGIGGVTPANAADVVAAGADGVAVISAITTAEDPEAATKQLSDAVSRGLGQRTRGSSLEGPQ